MSADADRDVLELLEYAAARLVERMVGLTDDEWSWRPVPGDPDVSIRWRLDHVTATLTEERNRTWLGKPTRAEGDSARPVSSAAAARAALGDAIAAFTDLVRERAGTLGEPIGAVAGPYGDATRRSFVLHVVDELVHHGAEAALLRDLYAGGAAGQPST
ncbi:DinB family protein [Curtobacterium sp. VKM Ac-2922]|uniref:DinB family protein n=1 Tax=Curtobacterium sp. VKM Ac-2922 TaxID=2929475 RepID=UPI001FB2FEAA|nr:DinB family protein [Curtobacterium sp. VKM Ac-2922]MCJ1714755.1 DinB family protein [Curtobacterium sp. VKM Ac-2922]